MKHMIYAAVFLLASGCSAIGTSAPQETAVPSASPDPDFLKIFSEQFPNEMVLDWVEGDEHSSFDLVVFSILPPNDVVFLHALSHQGIFQAVGLADMAYCNESVPEVSGNVVSFQVSNEDADGSAQCIPYFVEIVIGDDGIYYRTWAE